MNKGNEFAIRRATNIEGLHGKVSTEVWNYVHCKEFATYELSLPDYLKDP